MVNTLEAQVPVTPDGNPAAVAPVAPMVEQVILVIDVPIHRVCTLVPAADVNAMVLLGVTMMDPVAVLTPPVHPPVMVMV